LGSRECGKEEERRERRGWGRRGEAPGPNLFYFRPQTLPGGAC